MPDISPAKRSRIIREIHANPQRLWTGSVSGRRVRIAVIPTIPVLPPYEWELYTWLHVSLDSAQCSQLL